MSKDQAITKSTIQLWVIIKPKIPATSLKVVATITMFQKKCSVILDHAEPLLETGKKNTQCSTVEKPKPSKKTNKKMEPTWIPATFVWSKGRTQWISAPCGSSSWRQLAPGFCASQGCAGNQGLSFDKR